MIGGYPAYRGSKNSGVTQPSNEGARVNMIQLREADCKNCHKCIRYCPVKSIHFQNEQARIIEDDCILCGHCLTVCPQNAKYIQSDLDLVKGYIEAGQKVYVSLAPSYVTAFGQVDFAHVSRALKALGFLHVEETAIGAGQVSARYAELMRKGEMNNIITTCCPTIISLVEKYYPQRIEDLAPVVSPMLAHAKMMRNMYGPKIKVVFIGPCISKKQEALQNGQVNAVLLFDEVLAWLKQEGIDLHEADEDPAEMHGVINRLYPVPGGIIRTIAVEARKGYKMLAVDGLDRCIEVLENLETGKSDGYFIEMSACAGSCVKGPGLRDAPSTFLESKDMVLTQARKRTTTPSPLCEKTQDDFTRRYQNRKQRKHMPTDEEIRDILQKIDKTTPDKMYNCGACGYPTCRDKAIAVYQGKAELRMCIPYMRERAESMSNLIWDHTPNAIFLVDCEFNILEFNAAATAMFHPTDMDYKGLPIQMLLGEEAVQAIQEKGGIVRDLSVRIEGKTFQQTVVFVDETQSYLIIVKDVTQDEERNRKMADMRNETIEIAQEVINKQMRVAQEIASLLGETTGETKAVLTRLKKSMQAGEPQ